MEHRRFNIRVYGIWMQEGKLLVNEEQIRGDRVIKFPGGGMEYGEGTVDCLKREWQEEFGMEIEVAGHFYTTDYFQPSFFDDSQVVSIYYFVRPLFPPEMIVHREPGDRALWVAREAVGAELFTLPIDRRVGEMLQALWRQQAT